MTGNERIECKMCQDVVGIKAFSLHLLTYHDIKYHDYVKSNIEDFPCWKLCEICGSRTGNITKGRTCSKECDAKWKEISYAGRKGFEHTDESKEKIRIKAIDRNKDPEYRKRFCDNNPSKRPEVKKKISETRIRLGLAVGKNNGMYGKTHTVEAVKKIMSHRKMNTVERAVADILDKNGLKYYFQFFISKDGICKSYDFKIKHRNLILEVDGDFWHGNPECKNHWKDSADVQENDRFKEQLAAERGYKVVRVWQSEVKKDPGIVMRKLGI